MKNILVLLLSLIAATAIAQVKEHATNPNGLEYKLDTKVITENNHILFRYRENRVEINHPGVLGNTYDIILENADYEIKNGAFYITPRLEVELVDDKLIEAGKDFVVLTLRGKNSGQDVLRQEFKVINYHFPRVLINGTPQLSLSDKEYTLAAEDVMTNKIYTVKTYSVRAPYQELKGQGDKLSAEVVKMINNLTEKTPLDISVTYIEMENGQAVERSAGAHINVAK